MHHKRLIYILCNIILLLAWSALSLSAWAEEPQAAATQTTVLQPAAAVVLPDSASVELESVTVGLGGVYKNGFWSPVVIRTEGDVPGGWLELTTPDSDGTETVLRQPRTGTSETLYLPFGKANGTLTVRFYRAEGQPPVWEKTLEPMLYKLADDGERPDFFFPRPVPAERPLYLVTGDSNIGLAEALGELRMKEERRPLIAPVQRFSDLPDEWLGYEAVDCVVLTTTEPDFFDGVTADDPRLLALEKWVQNGGRLVLVAGGDAVNLLAEGGPLARFVPGRIDAGRNPEIRIANNLTQYVPKAKNLVMTGSLDSPFLTPPYLTDLPESAQVEVAEMETPLLVRMPQGLGTITFFAADLARAPLSSWSGRSGLVLKLFYFDTDRSRKIGSESLLVQLGYSDLAGQLRSTLDRFQDVRNIPFSLILLLAFVYILLIGPGDWYLTHKILKKPNLTWLTFPLYVILFIGLVVILMGRSKPGELRLNTAELLDVDTTTGLLRGTVWSGLYSPEDQRYDIRLTPSGSGLEVDGTPEVLLMWHGLTGGGLGGMAPKTISSRYWPDSWQLGSPRSELQDLPIRIHGTRSLLGRWLGQTKTPLASSLTSFDSVPVGTIVNPFSVPLTNTVLYYDRWAVYLGDLAPGETKIDIKTQRIERHLAIEGPEYPFEDSSRTMTQHGKNRYDTESTAIPYILRMMMFYQLSGGYEQLGLDNSLGHFVDLSDLLRTGRALLVGTIQDESPRPVVNNSAASPAATSPTTTSPTAAESSAVPFVGSTLDICPEGATDGATDDVAINSTAQDRNASMTARRSLIVRMILPVGKQK